MEQINLVFPHQLFEASPLLSYDAEFYLVEEQLFYRQYSFHQQKLAFHRASMKFYEHFLQAKGKTVRYIDAQHDCSAVQQLVRTLGQQGVKKINAIDPTDNWLEKRLRQAAHAAGIQLQWHENPLFLNSRAENATFFQPSKKSFFQTQFYIRQRKKLGVLLNGAQIPTGGKWSFDAENRKKYPSGKTPPPVQHPEPDRFYTEAVGYVQRHFPDNPGQLSGRPLYPTSFEAARAWFRQFLDRRFHGFGPYEDAIVGQELILHHSLLTPALNTGLLSPQYALHQALAFAEAQDVPLPSVEGFVRQIIGWREFVRGMYDGLGSQQRRRNFWGFSRPLPPAFYTGDTGIAPVDQVIRKVLRTGYCHHIERLMVLGNFMLLCEFDPEAVYRWFMELFIDAYDWVMVPNVYGMSQFADGGLLATKPYISGSNYLLKMSDFPKGAWQEVWDALFWRFLHAHRSFFEQNPRLGMLVRSFDKMPEIRQRALLERAETYLRALDASM